MSIDKKRRFEGVLFLIAYIACIPTANWLIQHVGTVCPPAEPCLIPVAPGGLMAPSGVLMVGLALVLRDLVQRRLGVAYGLGAIAIGTVISAALAPPVASARLLGRVPVLGDCRLCCLYAIATQGPGYGGAGE
jgi:uncharacterized PurR-regulated membrane protein YhhQ (DUF165 family)